MADGEADALGLAAGIVTVTSGVGQPNGTGLIEMVGVAETEADGEAWAWITIAVVFGQGGAGGIWVGDAALTISATRTATPPSKAVITKITAPHSRFM